MGFKDSRLGKIVEVFKGFGSSFGNFLRTVDVDDMDLKAAISSVNRDATTGDTRVSEEDQKLIDGTIDFNQLEAEIVTDRDETVGPVFSADAKVASKEDEEAIKRNEALKDETIRYVEGTPIKLKPVEPSKLEKGGKEREKIR
jgi:hypothetical protein